MQRDREIDGCIAFLGEAEKLKSVLRTTRVGDGSRRENSAEHSWQIGLMAMVLFGYAPAGTDRRRAIEMALLHDVVEVYAGDTFCFDDDALATQQVREAEAAVTLYEKLPESLRQQYLGLWEELVEASTPTSKFVVALDRLQPFLQEGGLSGSAKTVDGVTRLEFLRRLDPIRIGLPALWPIVSGEVTGWVFSSEDPA